MSQDHADLPFTSEDYACDEIDRDLATWDDFELLHSLGHLAKEIQRRSPHKRVMVFTITPDKQDGVPFSAELPEGQPH